MAILRERAIYLWVACGLPSALIFLQSVAPLEPTFKGQNLAVLVGIAAGAFILLLWIPKDRQGNWPRWMQVSLLLLLATWLFQYVIALLDGYTSNHTTFLVPIFLLLLFLKPISQRDLIIGLLVLGYGLVIIMLISLLFGGRFGIPDGFSSPESGLTRFPLISDLLGIETRWGGPLSSVNLVTPVGGLLVMLAVFIKGSHRILFLATGVLVLFLGQGRTSYFALAIALVVLALWSRRLDSIKFRTPLRALVLLVLAGVSLAYIWLLDPTLAGRTPIWEDYLGLVSESAVLGVGTSGISEYVASSRDLEPDVLVFDHAHSVYLDGLTRYGLIWLILTLTIFAAALVTTYRARETWLSSKPLALVVFLFFAGTTETVFTWAYASIYMLALILAVGLASLSRDSRSSNTNNEDPQRLKETVYLKESVKRANYESE